MAWDEKIKRKLGYCGEQVFIGNYVVFTDPKSVFLSDRVRIDPFCMITTRLTVGPNTQICSHVVIGGGSDQSVLLEGWNFIGYGSKLFTASEDYSGEYGPVCEFWGSNKINRGDITFARFAGVASDVMVFPSVQLPIGCTIGAKSLVYSSKHLIPWSVYYGNPLHLKKIRHYNKIRELSDSDKFLKEH